MTAGRFRLIDPLVALGVGLSAFALYLRTLAPGLLWGDPGEFQFAAWLAGLAHPTGYPLYLILGWLWTHALPWGDPAWRMNLFSALWGGVAAGLTYVTALRILQRVNPENPTLRLPAAGVPAQPVGWGLLDSSFTDRLLAGAAALIFAVTPTFWSQAVVAEVYTLHAVFVAAILLAALAWADDPRPARAYLLAGLAGLSLAHHRTTLLLLPGLILFLWLARGPALARLRGRHLAISLALLLTPLLFYLYIPLRAAHTPYLTLNLAPEQALRLYEPSLRGFLEHVSGSVFRTALGGGRTPWLSALVERLVGELSWAGLAGGLAGIAWLAWRARRLLVLTGMSFLAVVGFNYLYGIGDIYVFYIPAYLIWTLWMAVGLWACGWAIAVSWQRLRRRAAGWSFLLMGVLGLVLAGWLAGRAYAVSDRSGERSARTSWEAILAQPLPSGAILISNDRDEMVPQWYLKYVEGRRPDLDGLFPLIQPGPAWSDVGAVIEQALQTGRPVYLIKPMPGLEVKFNLEPATGGPGIGGLVRVLGAAPDDGPAVRSGVVFGDRLRLSGYTTSAVTVRGGETLTVILFWDVLAAPEHDYTSFVHLVNANGHVSAQSDHRPGGVYYPTSLWRPGDRLRDSHQLVIPADPGPQPYTLVVGLYRLAPDLQHLGSPQQVGQLPGR